MTNKMYLSICSEFELRRYSNYVDLGFRCMCDINLLNIAHVAKTYKYEKFTWSYIYSHRLYDILIYKLFYNNILFFMER